MKKNTASYLSFIIGGEEYAVDVGYALHILEMTALTKIPKSPPFMAGVINLRDRVLPVIDSHELFEISVPETNKSSIIVLEFSLDEEPVCVGLLVDQVVAVYEIEEAEIESSPSIGSTYRSAFISGMVQRDDHFIMLLDVSRMISKKQIKNIKQEQIRRR